MLITVLNVLLVVCIAAIIAIVVADLLPAKFVLENSDEVGLSRSVLPLLAALKAAGALGLVVGLLWLPWVGLVAATGLVLFYVGAVWRHVSERVLHNIAFPLAYLTLAVAAAARFTLG
ncbi:MULTISPECIES: DoxX family protein [unclassified Brachybacterium]|uniref:DoxX family protein n=1 Tax=unclassified Brachybacterium TaxID=2623841 RepID=UPI0036076861